VNPIRPIADWVRDTAPALLFVLTVLFVAGGAVLLVADQNSQTSSVTQTFTSTSTASSVTASTTASASAHPWAWLPWVLGLMGLIAFAFAIRIRSKRRL